MKENMKAEGAEKLAKYGMWSCCIVMLTPVGAFLLTSSASGGAFQSFFAFAPLVLCLGLHLMMHKMMGRSCHGHSDKNSKDVAPKRQLIEGRPSANIVPAAVE
ncbi:DUF2933 domain-containing protein [Tropicimonas sp. IMCC6043]|nr:DUF2933 domain-containing protein [Tropicimonas sp. IMCC6043]